MCTGTFKILGKNGRLEKSVEAHQGACIACKWNHEGARAKACVVPPMASVSSVEARATSQVYLSPTLAFCLSTGGGGAVVSDQPRPSLGLSDAPVMSPGAVTGVSEDNFGRADVGPVPRKLVGPISSQLHALLPLPGSRLTGPRRACKTSVFVDWSLIPRYNIGAPLPPAQARAPLRRVGRGSWKASTCGGVQRLRMAGSSGARSSGAEPPPVIPAPWLCSPQERARRRLRVPRVPVAHVACFSPLTWPPQSARPRSDVRGTQAPRLRRRGRTAW